MKDYIEIRKKTLLRWIAAIAVAAITVVLWNYFSSSAWKRTPRKIVVRSYNVLKADNKDILYFRSIGADSVLTDASLGCDSIMYGTEVAGAGLDLHTIVWQNKKILSQRLATLDSIIDEMEYYLDVHSVQDEGFDMVAGHRNIVEKKIEATSKIKAALDSIPPGATLEIKHVAIYADEDSVPFQPVFMEESGGIWLNGIWLKAAKNGIGVARDHNGRLIRGYWHADTLVFGKRTETEGTYYGQFDTNRSVSGHGYYVGNDGSFYEGHWQNDMRDGFGFAVNADNIRAGEWKNGKYRGERMNYTSERIYGIDISRYQHGKGRKYYPIHWNKLRIAHLGNISRKQVRGTVDYPVSFVYIKSTEGVSVRNRYYAADYRQARKYGIHCGAYHFFSTKSAAAAQARYFIKHTLFRRGDFPPVLDMEPTHAQIMKMGGEEALFKAIRTWMGIVKQHTGVRPILYVNQTFVNKYLSKAPDIKRDYNIWIARYGEYRPDVRLVYWQLSPDGRVNGIHGDVDINVFNGYQDRYELFLNTERIK